jgi:two-component system chemotaxis sensor kinase CheA
MKLRLVPIDQIFSRFTRLVRDTSTGLGKQVNLIMDGSGIELDRTVLDAITDPLLHILRNCVDHGIETPQERESNEKSPTGTIKLTAYGVGDQVAIKIEDDGRGINIDRLKAKAVEKKLITQDEADMMSIDEAISLLGTPGLSTAKEVTDVSGRGVGMDVVITQVEAVGGNVKITTENGRRTTIVLTIPLSVSIIGGLLINVSGDKYVLPLSSISTTVVVEANQIKSIHGQEAIVLREQVVPLVRVSKLLGVQETESSDTDKITIVIVNKGGKPYGLIVDSYDRKQEIVIKRLNNETHSSDLFTNATILGDGSVALILDPALLV